MFELQYVCKYVKLFTKKVTRNNPLIVAIQTCEVKNSTNPLEHKFVLYLLLNTFIIRDKIGTGIRIAPGLKGTAQTDLYFVNYYVFVNDSPK